MNSELCLYRDMDCQHCNDHSLLIFKCFEFQKETRYTPYIWKSCLVMFILSGEVLISHNNCSVQRVNKGNMCVIDRECTLDSSDYFSVIFLEINSSFFRNLIGQSIHKTYNSYPNYSTELIIKPGLMDFLLSVKQHFRDNISCPYMYNIKQKELSVLLRTYYSREELNSLFNYHGDTPGGFEEFVMDNYLKVKGVREFVDLSGMSFSSFNRKFKAHFKQSPYQWLIKQKSKLIYRDLLVTNKSIMNIVREFNFSDASHFNRYCKIMFGDSPSAIRRNISIDKCYDIK